MNAPANRPQLGDIRTMPIGEIAALPAPMLAPFQSWTDLRPASRSRQTVSSSGSVLMSVVLPMPGGPKMAKEVLFSAADRRSSALMMRRAMRTPVMAVGLVDERRD